MEEAKYFIDIRHSIVVQRFRGSISKEMLLSLLSKLYQDKAYLQTTKILTDFRHIKVSFHDEEVSEIAKFIQDNSKNDNRILNAIIADEPMVTAFSMIYQVLMFDMPNYQCSVFSTEEKAAEFLYLTHKDIENYLNEIK